jgi:hypothetical protein
MKKFNYKALANKLLDELLEIYESAEVLKILISSDFETNLLLELGFDIYEIDFIKQDKEMFNNDIALRESIKKFYKGK